MTATRATGLGGAKLLALYVLCTAATLSPLLWVSVPPLVDYPNHLARAWILTHASSIPELAANYTVHWRVLPDLAMDAVVVALSFIMPVELAGRVFIALTMILLVGGTAAVHRALHGRVGLWPLAALLGLYNTVLFWGFVSCLFGIGVALFAFAGWVATRSWPVPIRVVLFAPVVVLLLLGHLFAFGLYGLLVAGYELGGLIARRQWGFAALARTAALGLQSVPAIAVWAASLAHTGSTHTEYGDPLTKLIALLAPFTFGHGPGTLDMVTWLFCAIGLCFGLTRRVLVVAAPMRVPLLALVVAAVLMPNFLSGAWAADLRLPAVLPLALVASTSPRPISLPLQRLLVTVAAVLLGLRVWSVSVAFADYDAWFSEYRAATAVIASGARLLVVEPPLTDTPQPLPGLPKLLGMQRQVLFFHMPALTVIDRAVLFPYLFTGWTTIETAPRHADLVQRQGIPMTPEQLALSADPATAGSASAMVTAVGERPYWRDWPATFDYVFWMSFHPDSEKVPANLRAVAHGSYFNIYRIER